MLIALDFDDVICTHTEERIALAKKFGFKLNANQTHPSIMKELMGKEVYLKLASQLYTVCTPQAKPTSGIADLLKHLNEKHKLIIITARGEKEKPYAIDWLKKHKMGSYFDKLIFVAYQDKTPFLQGEKVEVFIENSWNNLAWLPKSIIKVLYNPYQLPVPLSFPHFEAKNMAEMRQVLSNIDLQNR